jgi:hypothetical protein
VRSPSVARDPLKLNSYLKVGVYICSTRTRVGNWQIFGRNQVSCHIGMNVCENLRLNKKKLQFRL